MLILTQTTDTLQVVLAGAITTNQLQCVASWRDITATPTYTPGRSLANTNSTTDVSLVASPAASTQRLIDYVSIYNADTANATVTVKLDANGTEYVLAKQTVAPGQTLVFTNEAGFFVEETSSASFSTDNLREYFPTIANNATDAEHDLDIGAARIWVSNGTTEKLINFTAATKRIDAVWAVGSNQGGLDTGTVANSTWYYIWAIYNASTQTADYLLSTSASAPTMPSGYTYKRLIHDAAPGAVLTNSSANVLGFRVTENAFVFNTEIIDHNQSSSFNTTQTLQTLSAPPSTIAICVSRLHTTGTLNVLTNFNVYPTNQSTRGFTYAYTQSNAAYHGVSFLIPVDSNRQVYRQLSFTDVTQTVIWTQGYIRG